MPNGLTIHEAAETTGWSARMLRYIEKEGLLEPRRSASGYRLYGPEELQRLRTLRELLQTHGCSLGDLAFALRLKRETELREAADEWFAAQAQRPSHVPADTWLHWEQEKHSKLVTTPH